VIEQNVQVVRCGDQRIWVRLGTQVGCSACDNGQGCGAGVFAKLLQRKPAVIELARQDVDVKAGDMVTLAFPEQIYLKMVLAHYGWPLLAALSGAAIAYALAGWLQLEPLLADLITLAGGVGAGSMALRYLKRRNNTESWLNSLQMAVYYPSATPNMCSGVGSDPEQI